MHVGRFNAEKYEGKLKKQFLAYEHSLLFVSLSAEPVKTCIAQFFRLQCNKAKSFKL